MSKVIRICKGSEIGKRAYKIGALNENWMPSHIVLNLTESRIFTEIRDGKVDQLPVRYSKAAGKDLAGKPVPAEEIVKELLLDNREVWTTNAHGSYPVRAYGENFCWYVDYDTSLDKFFEENELPVPADGKGMGQRLTEMAMGQVAALGFVKDGANVTSFASEGSKAIEEAKAKNAALEAEIAALKAAAAEKPVKEKVAK